VVAVVSSNRMSATSLVVAPSSECLRGEGSVWCHDVLDGCGGVLA